jgi:hypothetical protein
MISNVHLALILALILSIADYYSEGRFTRRKHAFKERFVSFVAGLSISYIFLHLFPQVYSGVEELRELIFILMLTGFTMYHVIEKWIYRHAPRDQINAEIEHEHAVTLFVYHFLIGIVFVSFMKTGIVGGLLYYIPVSLHVIINALPHSHKFQKWQRKMFYTSAPFLGAVLASIIPFSTLVNFALLGVVAGILLFLETREISPRRRHGSVPYFLLGVILYGLLIGFTWIN